jgi:hypothetical protein
MRLILYVCGGCGCGCFEDLVFVFDLGGLKKVMIVDI